LANISPLLSPLPVRLTHRVGFTGKISPAFRYNGEASALTLSDGCHERKTVKTTKLALLIVVLVAPTLVASAGDAKALYEKDCAKCHGTDGKGETKMGKKLGAKDYTDPKVQAALTDEAGFKATKEGLKDKEGKVLMKPAEGTSDEDVKALVAYMRTFKK
jgi:cytochrome c1